MNMLSVRKRAFESVVLSGIEGGGNDAGEKKTEQNKRKAKMIRAKNERQIRNPRKRPSAEGNTRRGMDGK